MSTKEKYTAISSFRNTHLASLDGPASAFIRSVTLDPDHDLGLEDSVIHSITRFIDEQLTPYLTEYGSKIHDRLSSEGSSQQEEVDYDGQLQTDDRVKGGVEWPGVTSRVSSTTRSFRKLAYPILTHLRYRRGIKIIFGVDIYGDDFKLNSQAISLVIKKFYESKDPKINGFESELLGLLLKARVPTIIFKEFLSPDAQDTFLTEACREAKADLARALIDIGCNVNQMAGHFRFALQGAAFSGDLYTIGILLDQGADINAQGGVYGSALSAACYWGFIEIVQLLLNRGADANLIPPKAGDSTDSKFPSPLHAAAEAPYLKWNLRTIVEAPKITDATRNKNKLAIMTHLIRAGADTRYSDKFYGTALHVAVADSNLDMVTLLLQHGADVHSKCYDKGTAISTASMTAHLDILRLLLNHGADPNEKSKDLSNGDIVPIIFACARKDPATVKELLKAGAYPNVHGIHPGNSDKVVTPLVMASWNEDIPIVLVEDLLVAGADPNLCGYDLVAGTEEGKEELPITVAIGLNNEQFIKKLLEYGADPLKEFHPTNDRSSGDTTTPLSVACSRGNIVIIKQLLNNIQALTSSGIRLFLRAVKDAAGTGNTACVAMLRDKAVEQQLDLPQYGVAGLEEITRLASTRGFDEVAAILRSFPVYMSRPSSQGYV